MNTVRHTILIFCLAVLTTAATAQQKAPVCESPEKPAYFAPGNDSLNRFIARNIHMSAFSRDSSIKGKAFVTFIVEMNGTVSIAEVMRSSGDKGFDAEALRIVKAMPPWVPANNKGTAVRSSVILPFAYQVRQ